MTSQNPEQSTGAPCRFSNIRDRFSSAFRTVSRLPDGHKTAFLAIAPGLAALASLAWTLTSGGYIYGEDSFSFVNPFSYNRNPWLQYDYTAYTTYPVASRQPLLYAYAFVDLVEKAGASPALSEVLLLLALTAAAAYGVFWLLLVIDRVGQRQSTPHWLKLLLVWFYIANPFTLSIIWWRFQAWTFLWALLPFWLTFLLSVRYSKRSRLATAGTVLLISNLLAPGLAGGYSVALAIGSGFFVLLEIVGMVLTPRAWPELGRRVSYYVAITALALGWSTVPLLVSNGTSLASATNYAVLFASEAPTTTILNTMRLVGFSWLYNVPTAYAWHGLLEVVLVAGFGATIALLAAALLPARRPGFVLIVLLLVVLCLVSAGSAPYFQVDLALLSLGGPFLVLTNAYYLIGEYLPILFVGFIYAQTGGLERTKVPTSAPGDSQRRSGSSVGSPERAAKGRFSFAPRKQGTRWLVAIVLIGLTATTAACSAPLLSGQAYVSSGDNVGTVALPPQFAELDRFLSQGYSGPNYYAAVLPMTTAGAWMFRYGSESFPDTSFILGEYIPYPTLWRTSNPTAEQVYGVLNNQSSDSNLLLALVTLHVRYVVVDPFYNSSTSAMTTTPWGTTVNLSAILSSMNESIGPPTDLGGVDVYEVRNSTPLWSVEENPSVVTTPQYSTYIQFLSQTRPGEGDLNRSLELGLWSSHPVQGWAEFAPTEFQDPSVQLNASGFDSSFEVLSDGTVSEVQPLDAADLVVSDPLLMDIANESYALSGMSYANQSIVCTAPCNGQASSGTSLEGPSFSQERVNLTEVGPMSWIELASVNQSIRVVASLYYVQGSSESSFELAAYLNSSASPALWHTVSFVPLCSCEYLINATYGSDSVQASVLAEQTGRSAAATLNITALSVDFPRGQSSYSIQSSLIGSSGSLGYFSVFRPLSYRYVVLVKGRPATVQLNVSASWTASGNLRLSGLGPVTDNSSILASLSFPGTSLWALTAGGCDVTPVNVSPGVNAFELTGCGPSVGPLDFNFVVYTDEGLWVSIVEVGSSACLLLAMAVRVSIRARKSRAP